MSRGLADQKVILSLELLQAPVGVAQSGVITTALTTPRGSPVNANTVVFIAKLSNGFLRSNQSMLSIMNGEIMSKKQKVRGDANSTEKEIIMAERIGTYLVLYLRATSRRLELSAAAKDNGSGDFPDDDLADPGLFTVAPGLISISCDAATEIPFVGAASPVALFTLRFSIATSLFFLSN